MYWIAYWTSGMCYDLRICLGLLGLLSLGGCRDTAAPGVMDADVTALNIQVLAFSTNRDGNDEIYRIVTDGTGLARLTFDPAPDFQPVSSPSGKSWRSCTVPPPQLKFP